VLVLLVESGWLRKPKGRTEVLNSWR